MLMESLSDRRKRWLEVLKGKDPHSVEHQLVQMVWNLAAYRSFQEALRLAQPHKDSGVKVNTLLFELLRDGFLTMQSAAARRLMDATYGFLHKKNPSYSLISVVNDIIDYAPELTREKILAAEGVQYDYSADQLKEREHANEQIRLGKKAWTGMNPNNWHHAVYRHRTLDALTHTTEEKRAPSNAIDVSILKAAKARITDACETIKRYATKYIAHASAPDSRKADGTTSFTWAELEEAIQSLYEVASFICVEILGDSMPPPVPTATYDQFEYLDRPIVTRENKEVLNEKWREFERRTAKWTLWKPANLIEADDQDDDGI